MRVTRGLWLAMVAACGGSDPGDPTDARVVDAASDGAPAPDASPNAFHYEVTILDINGALSPMHDQLIACARGGLDEWGTYLSGMGTLTVEIRVTSTATGRMAGASTSNVSVGPCAHTASCTVVEEQAIRRLRTGLDNPAMVGVPDVHIDVDPSYWNTQVWVDPDPQARTAPVPGDRLDCVSLFTHELGHAFGMVGFRDLTTFQPTVAFQSLYDDQIQVGTDTLTFNGPLTVGDFGPIPLTRTSATQNVYHYGDASTPGPIDTLLMNGIVYEYGHRYRVQKLDARIVEDLGVPVYRLPAQ
ncbi:MAG: hypothetical protein K8W52_04830 [Deltaproteobacteria bacterium]|nr:hypothetical protein [Deltaproteobacteria bacterium]